MGSEGERPVHEGAILTGCVCPACGVPLYEVVFDDATILACASCGGLAASREQVETMLAGHRDGRPPARPPAIPLAAHRAAPGHPRTCPRCRGAMGATSLRVAPEPPADWCARCHLVWLDRDRLAELGLARESATG